MWDVKRATGASIHLYKILSIDLSLIDIGRVIIERHIYYSWSSGTTNRLVLKRNVVDFESLEWGSDLTEPRKHVLVFCITEVDSCRSWSGCVHLSHHELPMGDSVVLVLTSIGVIKTQSCRDILRCEPSGFSWLLWSNNLSELLLGDQTIVGGSSCGSGFILFGLVARNLIGFLLNIHFCCRKIEIRSVSCALFYNL